MRILVLSNLYPPNVIGGYERLCFDVTSALAASGHEMTVLTSRYGGGVAEYPRQRVHRDLTLLTGADVYTPFSGTPQERELINQSNLDTLHRVVSESRPDVIFAWNLFFLDAGFLAALERGAVRTVVMLTDNWLLVMRNPIFVRDFFQNIVHGSQPFVPPPQPGMMARIARRLSARWKGRASPAGLEAIFGAAFVRDLYGAGGATFARHRVIHNGVRQAGYATAPNVDRGRLVHTDTLRLLFAGRLVDLKGAHTAVAALSQLDPAALGVTRVELTILGDAQDAAYVANLHESIRQSGRAGDIMLRPTVPEDQLLALFGEHDVYLFPSLYEPFSLTLIHALALGIPTVASRVGGNVEIIRDGESGLLFDKGDAASLAACVRRLARDGELRARLAAGGQRSAARFTFEKMVGEMAAFLGKP